MRRPELLRDRRLLALLVAEMVSTTGSQMTWLALPWFVLVTTGSATRTSFVVAAELVGHAHERRPMDPRIHVITLAVLDLDRAPRACPQR